MTFLLWGFVAYLAATIIISVRLSKVISVQEISLSTKEAIYLTFIGYFFNNFLPTSFGGDLLKAYYAGKKSKKKAGAFAGVLMDRILATVPFTLIPAFTITFYTNKIGSKGLVAAIYILFAISLICIWLLLHKTTARYIAYLFCSFKERSWYERIKGGYNFLNAYSKHKAVLISSFVLSVLAQAVSIISAYFFAKAIGLKLGLCIFFIVVPIVWVMSLLPSLNGLGIREGAFVYLLKPYTGVDKAFAISLLVLATLAVFSIVGGVIYIFKKGQFVFKEEIS
jgi:uncharacterized protein (TIRG00374 family)